MARILMLSATFPYPATKGGTQGRTFNLLKTFAQNHKITLVTQRADDVSEADIEGLSEWVSELKVFPSPAEASRSVWDKLPRQLDFWLNGTPPNVRYRYDPAIQAWLDSAIANGGFETITCEHSVNEIYVRPAWREQVRTVINVHSSLYRTCQNQLATNTSENAFRDRLYLPLLEKYERRVTQKFSRVVVTTDEDETQMRTFAPTADVQLIPNGVALETFPCRTQDPGGHALVFVGGLDYFINIDAAVFLGAKILPKLQETYPDATLTLVGSKPAPQVQALAQNPSITVTGRVPTIVEYLHKATVAVIPMRTGFGMKFKTLESMAAGVPVVASDRGLEGLVVDDGSVSLRALRANTLEENVAQISRLFADAQLRAQLSAAGRDLIETHYTWETLGQQYEQAITG
ncbi:MAG: glycosyltransferase family 4 protein [Cyanobacteria bacterium P01_H01_bin.15]